VQVDESSVSRVPSSFTDQLRVIFRKILDPIGAFLNRLGISPNALTLIGLAGSVVAAFFIASSKILLSGIVLLLTAPLDALDGTMARLRGEPTKFGGFLDSVVDRYSELIVFSGFLYYFLAQEDALMVGLVFAAAAGSVLVSYTRARAEGLGFEAKCGILTRLERYIVIILCLLLGFPKIGIVIIAILANLTALQRILQVHRQARKREGKG